MTFITTKTWIILAKSCEALGQFQNIYMYNYIKKNVIQQ